MSQRKIRVSNLTPEERKLRASLAAHRRWANTDRASRQNAAAKGQAGLLQRFEDQVDPDGTLPPHERAVRAQNLMSAHMKSLALASSKARRNRKAA